MRDIRWSVGLTAALLLTLAGCASTEFAAVNNEPGFYYGYGAGSTEAAAQESALQDLVYNTFTETGSIKKQKKTTAGLTAEMKAAVAPLAVKPFMNEKKSPTSFTIVYRIKYADWAKAEAVRLAGLQTDLGGRFAALSAGSRTLGERLVEAVRISRDVDRQGVTLALRVGGPETALLSEALVQWTRDQVAGASLKIQPSEGLINAEDPVRIVLAGKDGKPLAGIPLTAAWTSDSGSAPAQSLVTDAQGSVSVSYPANSQFRNVRSTLKVATRIASLLPENTFLNGLDAGLKAEAGYRNAVVMANLKTPEVRVEGGTFTIGAVAHDRRAGSKEKARTATLAPFFMDVSPVTNAQYRSFLETTDVPRSQWPDFLAEGDLAGADQPVVGVTLAEAKRYAEWVSGVLGVKKRLPTEAEFEVAARAGQSVIYPWGDQAPTDGVRANYSGNKRFAATSPVGAFDNGANPLGLFDMVGNVWQWTSSGPDAQITADPSFIIIKGGSWLDGPAELRISNRRAVDPAESASDLGFRLVREDN